ncbi:immunoglobulin-like domain-containing protein [Nocardioides lianchengensis]|uniref:Ig-like domain (Group 3) n=1 Tax=Nocardioides lianchengensis TaxID=1045774 RepID=A0A1G6QAS0_9ACTN|nr:immunoglobulin-like domain-containing protein [Nocardioides lianchengensis]NYG12157.1 hypothetical protein [Nocardioides lianchengensis]SDC89459.1 Ig-like domain (group 3) [Nocardioides lianchengensis]
MRMGTLRSWLAGTAALAVSAAGLAVVGPPAPATAVEGDLTTDLVGWWKLDETSGTTAADSSGNGRNGTVAGTASWNAGDGFTFSGGASSGGNAITLPNNLLTGLEDVTVDFDAWVDPTLTSGNWFMFNLGNLATYPNGTGYLFTTNDANGRYRGTIAEDGFASEQSVSRAGHVARGQWRHLTLSIDGGTPAAPGAARLYEDGVLVASNTNLTTNPGLLGTPDGTTTRNVLGRSAYAGDASFKGRLRDFRVYSRALTGAEAASSAQDTSTAAAEADRTALTLGDTSAVVANLALPASGTNGSTINWATSNAAAVTAAGVVTRPSYGQPDGTATLTATITRGAVTRTKDFAVTVLAEEQDDAGKAQAAVAAVTLVKPDDVRGNLTLPTAGRHETALTWASSAPAVVSATGVVTRPAYGAQPVDVTLTVTAARNAATASRPIVVRVQPAPAPADYDAYAFAYFTGESTDDGEKIYLGASKGNDPLDYDELNDGDPVLESTYGERGLRDPFIIRSHEGDRFWMLATDLKIYGGNDFGTAQETGSKYLEIWESTDLVNWSPQRHVKVSSDLAGNTWAPEAFYDEEAGEYVVYWASAFYPTAETAGRDINTSYQEMVYVTTRDFVTFSDPQPWIDVKRGTGRGMIDATVVQDGDTYYRVVKDEAVMRPRQERSTDLRATVTGSLPTTSSPATGWQLVKADVGLNQPNPWGGTFTGGEGPTVFRDNEVEDRWYMFVDQPSYHGGQGYLAFRTDDIGSGNWTSVPSADLPASPRHGTVIPVTQAELDGMRAAFQPELLVASVGDAAVRTREGVAPALPATVPATFGDGTSGPVAVTWDAVAPSSYDGPGTFTVTGTVTRGSADRPVATVTVTDAADPVVTFEQEPDGEDGWWVTDPASVAVTATDDTGVTSVETALDGGAWTTTAGSSATVSVPGDGRHTVAARALDTTGNLSVADDVPVLVDTTEPVSRATAVGRQVTVRAADATSGVARVETRVAGAEAWTSYDGPVPVDGTGGTVEYRAVDVAGNVEATHALVVPPAGSELAATTVVATAEPGSVRYGAAVPVVVRVKGGTSAPTGTVRVLSGGRWLAAGTLADGRLRVVVDSADLGRTGAHTLVVRYYGDASHRADEDAVPLTVTRAVSTTRVSVSGRRATVRVATDPAGQLPARVRVVLARGGKATATRELALSRTGTASWRLPRLRAGTWKVTATVPTTPTLQGSSATDTLKARRR